MKFKHVFSIDAGEGKPRFFPAATDEARFADRAGGAYTLGTSSPSRGAGTDGKNIVAISTV